MTVWIDVVVEATTPAVFTPVDWQAITDTGRPASMGETIAEGPNAATMS
jgi:hypothetical protein